ncbi:hypothetical protein SASPL_133827 [Salvia splendens]|uniref:Annexin n=1 Tax=Salvia splendens TaxID=180675 RepID=A0A8X8ZIV4_SALSN|nr:hypothetical protein SASPL_133827 [Salvia splendens]
MSTIVFPDHHSAVADAETLKKAFHGRGTDDKAVIGLLGRRNALQRKLIRQAYEELYQEHLVKRLESELSGDFELELWAHTGTMAKLACLHNAMQNKAFADEEVIRIITTRSKLQIQATLNKHKDDYSSSITKALRMAGTDEDWVTRAEKDLEGIKEVYLKRNSHSLEQAITKETSGHYKAFLLTLLGKQD